MYYHPAIWLKDEDSRYKFPQTNSPLVTMKTTNTFRYKYKHKNSVKTFDKLFFHSVDAIKYAKENGYTLILSVLGKPLMWEVMK